MSQRSCDFTFQIRLWTYADEFVALCFEKNASPVFNLEKKR